MRENLGGTKKNPHPELVEGRTGASPRLLLSAPRARPRILPGLWRQCQDLRPIATQFDVAPVAPGLHEVAVVRRQRIARLSAGDDEARVVEIGEIEDRAQ